MTTLVRNLARSVILACLLSMIFTRDAYAYLDPGSGSYILQMIVAGLLGASLAIKIYWRRIRAYFSRLFGRGEGGEQGEQEDGE